MKKNLRLSLFGALIFILLTSACGADQGATPTLIATSFPTQALSTSTPLGGLDTTGTAETQTATTGGLETPTVSTTEIVSTLATSVVGSPIAGNSQTSGIPVTGVDIVLVECQFCVDQLAHALLVLPDTATFKITSAPTTTTSSSSTNATEPNCTTVEVNNGKQVVLCSGSEMTPITLNICTNGTTCTDFPVDLLPCPLVQATNTAAPNDTQAAPGTGAGSPTATVTPVTVINTPTP